MTVIKSMTGFGNAEISNNNLSISAEIRSLNGKFFDCQIRMPKVIRDKETEVRLWASTQIIRGSVQININVDIKNPELLASGFKINEDLAVIYGNKLRLIAEKLELDKSQIMQQLLQLPEVILTKDSLLREEDYGLLFKVLNLAFEDFDAFRIQEGFKTSNLLNEYLNEIRDNRSAILKLEGERKLQILSKLQKSIDELKEAVLIDKNRFEQELIYYLEKLDIAEELSRLSHHLDYFEKSLIKDPTGKKLGFICQEIGREINTLGSKANHFPIQQAVVEMKESLEKIKEQVLNIL